MSSLPLPVQLSRSGPWIDAPPRAPALRSATRRAAPELSSAIARNWLTLAVGSLVIAGLLSLAVVIGRLPVLSRLIDDPLFFKRCLVVHVDLALVVWFYAFIAGLLTLRTRPDPLTRTAFVLSAFGVLAMLAGGVVRGAQPILANYVPVIDHPLFFAGLGLFAVGLLLTLVHVLGRAPSDQHPLPVDALMGLRAAAVLVLVAGATWVSARAGLPAGVDAYTRAEFLAWGPGHVLQAANTAAMLGVWLWLLRRITGASVLRPRQALLVFSALVLPQCAAPLLTARGTLDTLYHTGATQLMRWAIFPTIAAVFSLGLAHLFRHRRAVDFRAPLARACLAGLVGSAALATLGVALGACIRSSTTLVPAHYHASLGAVTLAFMTAAYLVCRRDAHRPSPALLVSARRQLTVFAVGQSVFAVGFAIGGAYGLGRKAYAAEQHVRSAGEVLGLVVMGLGGLVAVIGGLWFLHLVLRELRRWWTPAAAASSATSAPVSLS